MLLGTNEPQISLVEDLNLSPVIQFPMKPDTTVLDMFPVAELSNLNNTDFSFLDDVVLPEDNQFTEIKNMADLNSTQGNSFPETNALCVDWLSGNIGLDTLIAEPNFHQSAELNNIFCSSYSDVSHSICSEPFENSSIDQLVVSSPITENESLMTERLDYLVTEERIYSSDDSSVRQGNLQQAKSPLVFENEDIVSEHNVEDDNYSLAGKKYFQMRQKNNIASQRSRKLRKQKNVEMVERLKKLEVENKELTKLATEMEKQRDALQRLLLQKISKK